MLRKLGCFTVKEWNSCGIYLISTNLTYFVHLKSSSRNTSGSMLFASQLNFFFETPKNLADWLTNRIFRWFQATSQAKAIWSSAANSCTTTRRGRLAAMGGRRSSPKATRKEVQIIGAGWRHLLPNDIDDIAIDNTCSFLLCNLTSHTSDHLVPQPDSSHASWIFMGQWPIGSFWGFVSFWKSWCSNLKLTPFVSRSTKIHPGSGYVGQWCRLDRRDSWMIWIYPVFWFCFC